MNWKLVGGAKSKQDKYVFIPEFFFVFVFICFFINHFNLFSFYESQLLSILIAKMKMIANAIIFVFVIATVNENSTCNNMQVCMHYRAQQLLLITQT